MARTVSGQRPPFVRGQPKAHPAAALPNGFVPPIPSGPPPIPRLAPRPGPVSAGASLEGLEGLHDWAQTSPEKMQLIVRRARALKARIAREDINEFMEFVMRNEETREPLHQSPLQETYQTLFSAHDRVMLWTFPESGKTLNVIGRILWELGRNPSLRIAYISSVQNQADKALDLVKSYITHSKELHEVFPNLRPGETWKGDAITIARATHAKDFSIQCAPAGASGIQGSRIDLLILDDILNFDNTLTEHRRNYIELWYKNTLNTRLTEFARVWCLGNAFHPDDLYHRLSTMAGWVWRRFPVIDENGKLAWPEQWNAERIKKKQDELGAQFAQQYLCQARDDANARFKKAWLEKCLKLGEGKTITHALTSIPAGYRVYTGVDLGLRKKSGSDLTVFFTIIVHPNETREVLCVESGRWSGPEIVQHIIDTYHRFGGIIYVESVAAQKFILEFASAISAVPIMPFQTGKNKHDPVFGFESIGAEMANGKWVIPNKDGKIHPEIAHWLRELLYYDPDGHTGDRAMASWIAREGARTAPKRKGRIHNDIDTMAR